MQTEELTSWRMSSSLGMMESSRVSSLQRQGEGQASGERDLVAGPRLGGSRKARHSPVLDKTYDLGVCLPNDALPVHLHQPVSWGQGWDHM